MCGRYASTGSRRDLVAAFDATETVGQELPASYNVAPTQTVNVVLERAPRDTPDADPARILNSQVKWGLVPSWARDPKIGSRMINARSETITQKPAFKAAAARRRCIVPADGYYEWTKNDEGAKIPFFLHGDTEGPLAMAGLYELWPNPKLPEDDPGRWLWTCTVLTRPATDATGHIHDRSPVILPETFIGPWLDPTLTDRDDVDALLNSIPEPHLIPYEVSTAVNSPRNNRPDLLTPVHR
ncbi:SOS response-associated peptidase [Rhodococcus sp. NPDC003318]|uniref:SOS response-associated peptidase n=1 Tax=Rhodococcus sp. NPDC003318 TaxID=3364503 RepID=UPI003695A434